MPYSLDNLRLKDLLGPVTRVKKTIHSTSEQLLSRNVKRFRGGLVFKAHRLLYHSSLGLRVIKKKKIDLRDQYGVLVRWSG